MSIESLLQYQTLRGLHYIAGPYTAKMEDGSEDHARVNERMRITCLCDAELMKLGFKTCSPMYKHLIRHYAKETPGDWQYWGEYSRAMLILCEHVIVLKIEGWQESIGLQAEIDFAKEHNIPISIVEVSDLLGVE